MRNGTMIKVIASDMDGTLLGDSHRLDEETFEVIEQAQKRGIRFMLATGRNYEGAMHAMGELGQRLTCDYLVGSGAEVRNPKREVVSRKEMDKTLCKDVYEILQRYPVSVIFRTDSKDYQVGTPEDVEMLGELQEVMVFGDSLNDFSMLEMDFGATVAMENADPEVKAVAKYVTKSNTEHGVAYVIEKLLESLAE